MILDNPCHLVVPHGLGVVQGVEPVTVRRGHAHCPAPASVQSLHCSHTPTPVTQQVTLNRAVLGDKIQCSIEF